MIQTANLRCEYRTTPLGLDILNPRLSWELVDERRGARQSAYQVQAAASEAALLAGRADLWDSGKVASDQAAHVPYAGLPLASRQRVWWRVRTWDADGKPGPWSAAAWWEMGLLERSAWEAEWIGSPLAGDAQTSSPAPFLRARFALGQKVTRARLYITALGVYEAQINGQLVSPDVFAPGWTDYAIRAQYQVYDVTGLLRAGENTLSAVLGDGWYCGFVGWGARQPYGDRPKLLARLELTLADGSTQAVATGPDWQWAAGPVLASDMQNGEIYDARLELADADDSRWQPVVVFPDPGIQLSAMRGSAVRRIREIQPVAEPRPVTEEGVVKWIFDLGQNMVGRARVCVSGAAGTAVTLRHAEVLNPDGTLYMTNLRRAQATDQYTLKGSGTEVYEPRFTFHGFRYVELSGLTGPATRDMLTGVVLHTEMTQTGSFACSDPLINQLQHNIEWGQRGNFLDVPTDCPQRNERLGWTGDAQVFTRTAAFNMDVAAFFTKWLRDLEDDQAASGSYPAVAPNPPVAPDVRLTQEDGGPAWADAGVICPWTIYQCFGDTQLLAERYESMKRYVEYLSRTSRRGIRNYKSYKGFKGHGDWLALDGSSGPDLTGRTPKDLIGTAFYASSARLLAQTAEVLGKPEDARRYFGLSAKAREAFQKRFVTADGTVTSGTQTAAVLALHFDLLPAELRPAVVEALVRDIREHGNHLTTGFVGSPYLAFVLSENGRADVAYDLLNQQSWPSWLYPVTKGATTIWERWDGWTEEKGFADPGMNSFNHYAYGAIGAWLYAVVAGIDIDPQHPGYRHIIMRPRPGGGLTAASAALHAMPGVIRSAWMLDGDRFDWQIRIPANASATVYVPAGEGESVREESGITESRREPGYVVYEVGAGSYHFSTTSNS
ncbi:MAG TPA: family 78 glycoside hydrolase catalytic domain [Anaerolineaceae bacterium]